MTPLELQDIILTNLYKVYSEMSKRQGIQFSINELASQWGLAPADLNQISTAISMLHDKGLVKRIGEGPVVLLTPLGVERIESSLKPPEPLNKTKIGF